MKKVILILGVALLSACSVEPFSGFVVCKEYTLAHMSNETPRIVRQMVVIVPRVVHHRRPPHKVDSRWTIYVANKGGVRTCNVDSLSYSRIQLGQRYTINYGSRK